MKNIISTLVIISCLFISTVSFFSCTSAAQKEDAIPALLDRKGAVGPTGEATTIKETYTKAVAALKENPDDMKQYISLASAFIMEGRVTGNGSYYSNAAVKMLDKVLNNKTTEDLEFQALSLKSAVLLNMHQFKDALTVAQKGVALNAFNAGIFGALVDANVELGNYDEAVKDCDKMISIRPDLRSYSRASYIRQIYGDNKGAIDAMKMAVQAGVPGEENTEWCRINLADLYLNTGNVDSASILYRTSLVYRPGYAFAQMGLAKVERARKNYDGAIEDARTAIKTLSDVAFVSYLGDLYELKGDNAKAKEVRSDVVNLLEDGQKEEAKDALVKHNVSREMATAYLNAGDLDKALSYAKTDWNMRPDNIDANELMAWIYYMKGDYANAKLHADKMLKTNTKNANTLYKAGLIYAAAGDAPKGDGSMKQAMAISPYIDQRIMNAAKRG